MNNKISFPTELLSAPGKFIRFLPNVDPQMPVQSDPFNEVSSALQARARPLLDCLMPKEVSLPWETFLAAKTLKRFLSLVVSHQFSSFFRNAVCIQNIHKPSLLCGFSDVQVDYLFVGSFFRKRCTSSVLIL